MVESVLFIEIDGELHERFQQRKRVDDHIVDEETLSGFSSRQHVAYDVFEDLIVEEEQQQVEGHGAVVEDEGGGGGVDVDQLGGGGGTYSERKMRWLWRMKVKTTKTTRMYISKSNLRSTR